MALTDSLISYWKLDEASGTRNDSHGTNHLTDVNTVTQAAGKIVSAGQFTRANSEYLSIADNASISTGDIDFCFTAWVYADTLAAGTFLPILIKDNLATAREFRLGYDTSEAKFRWAIGNGATINNVNATTFGVASTTTWYFIYVQHNAAANTVGISINNGTLDSAATSVAASDAGNAFRIGGWLEYPDYWDGRIDEVGFWKRLLTTDERTQLYNSGNGYAYGNFSPWTPPRTMKFQAIHRASHY